jgi:hypothetical protein
MSQLLKLSNQPGFNLIPLFALTMLKGCRFHTYTSEHVWGQTDPKMAASRQNAVRVLSQFQNIALKRRSHLQIWI